MANGNDDLVLVEGNKKRQPLEITISDDDVTTESFECELFDADFDCGLHPTHKPIISDKFICLGGEGERRMKRLYRPIVSCFISDGKLIITVKIKTIFDPAPPPFEVKIALFYFAHAYDSKESRMDNWNQFGEQNTFHTRIDFPVLRIDRNTRYHMTAVAFYEDERSEFSHCRLLDCL